MGLGLKKEGLSRGVGTEEGRIVTWGWDRRRKDCHVGLGLKKDGLSRGAGTEEGRIVTWD